MSDSTPSVPNRQMSLIEAQFANVRRIEQDGIEYFSIMDIMIEFSGTRAASQYWRDTKKRLLADGFQTQEKILQLKLEAADGKMRLTDFADGETMMRIVQSIPSPKAEPLRDWLAELGYRAYEEEQKPALAVQRRVEELERYEKAGYANHPAIQLFRKRHQNIDNFKALMATIEKVCEKPNFGHFVNAEYLALFGEIADDLKLILETKSIRDALPMVQLTTLSAAEARLQLVIENQRYMTMDMLLETVELYIRPMGDDLKRFCDLIGVHHITGKRLLTDGK
jgi:DNA-damage-inducible protein D